jgi:CDP-4-dehydro-6-deoxyglucose reductase
MSAYWFQKAQLNDLLHFEGPRGTFFWREVKGLDVVMLATGTGIAPIKAMLEELAGRPPTEQPHSLSLIWGGRVPADVYWNPAGAHPALKFTPTLSRADAAWTGARKHVQNILIDSSPNWPETVVYACGSSAMVGSARTALVQAGLPPKRFFADAFVSSN